jgi:tetratricopeptide (TPR) repeat protein
MLLGIFIIGGICYCWALKKDHGEAIAELTNTIQAQPQNWSLYYARGKVYANAGVFDSAIADYTYAIELNPSNDVVFEHRARAYYEIGEQRKAVDDYLTALRINPNNKAAKLFLITFVVSMEMFLKNRDERPTNNSGFMEKLPVEMFEQLIRESPQNTEDSLREQNDQVD